MRNLFVLLFLLLTVSVDAFHECTRNCTTLLCGNDGCGGQCECYPTMMCRSGLCVGTTKAIISLLRDGGIQEDFGPEDCCNWGKYVECDASGAIVELRIQNVKFTHLSQNISTFSSLERLHLTNTELTDLPKEVADLEKLQELDIRNNAFQKIPLAISLLRKAVEIHFIPQRNLIPCGSSDVDRYAVALIGDSCDHCTLLTKRVNCSYGCIDYVGEARIHAYPRNCYLNFQNHNKWPWLGSTSLIIGYTSGLSIENSTVAISKKLRVEESVKIVNSVCEVETGPGLKDFYYTGISSSRGNIEIINSTFIYKAREDIDKHTLWSLFRNRKEFKMRVENVKIKIYNFNTNRVTEAKHGFVETDGNEQMWNFKLEESPHVCDEQYCKHGGRCPQLNSIVCNCAGTGYSGERCQHLIDPCLSVHCQHNGYCQSNSNNPDFYCRCRSGWTGRYCSIKDIWAGKSLPITAPESTESVSNSNFSIALILLIVIISVFGSWFLLCVYGATWKRKIYAFVQVPVELLEADASNNGENRNSDLMSAPEQLPVSPTRDIMGEPTHQLPPTPMIQNNQCTDA